MKCYRQFGSLRWAVIVACAMSNCAPSDDQLGDTACDQDLDSERPCRGLLPECEGLPATAPSDGLVLFAYNNCPAGQYYTNAVLSNVSFSANGASFQVPISEAQCVFQIDVISDQPTVLEWPWLSNGQAVDVELWDPVDGSQRGGDALWLILEVPNTSELLLAAYSGNDYLVRNGTVSDRLEDVDVALNSPECEHTKDYFPELLIHRYRLELSTEAGTFGLSEGDRIELPASGTHPKLNVATGVLENTYDLGLNVLDARYGLQINFAVWPVE